MYVASIIYAWRPFISQLYDALLPASDTGAPRNCVWTKQVEQPVKWILEFLATLHQHRIRAWTVANYCGAVWDASPVGFGAVHLVDGHLVEYLAGEPHEFEIEFLGIVISDSESQQVMESLAGLIALRTWSKWWQQARVTLSIRSDNMGALTLLSRLTSSSARLNILAREFSLDLGNAAFSPDIVQHIPGFTNNICDALSRLPLW